MLNPPIEGHHIASKEMIEASLRTGIASRVLSVESRSQKQRDNKGVITINSRITRLDGRFWFFPGVVSAFDDLLASLEILRRARFLNVDLVHVLNMNKEAFLTIRYISRFKLPVLLHFFHSSFVLRDDVFLIRKLVFKTGLYSRGNNHVLTVNRSMLHYFVEKIRLNPKLVHYAPYPVDTDRFKPLDKKRQLREKYALSPDRPTVVYVGSLAPSRGIINLLKSVPYWTKSMPNALLFVSHPRRQGEEVYERYVQHMIRSLKLQENVVVQGPCRNIEEVYNLADLVALPFIRPYWVDPPLVLLEAMSCGSTVVTTPVGAISEVVESNEDGVFADFQEPCLLGKTIVRLLEDPQTSLTIGRKARGRVLKENSYEAVGSNLGKIYDSILNN